MHHILVAFNAIHFPAHVRAAAVHLASEQKAGLTALYLPYADKESDYPFPNDLEGTASEEWDKRSVQEDRQLREHMIRLLQDEAAAKGVAVQVLDVDSTDTLLQQTTAAQLLVLDAELHFTDTRLSGILAQAKCPVYISGVNTPVVDRLVLAYDGSAKSQYAIQKLAGLFPSWKTLPALLVSVNRDPAVFLAHKEFLNQWMPAHFKNVEQIQLNGEVVEELISFLKQYPANTLVVMGAYGRGALSRLLRNSTAARIITETRLSLFLAHP